MRGRNGGLLLTLCVALVVVALGWFVYRTPGSVLTGDGANTIPASEGGDGGTAHVTVRRGESAKEIGATLAQEHVVRSSRLFEALVGVTGVGDSLEAGDYEFDRGLPAIEVVSRIAQGKTASREVNIPEGRRIEEVGEILEKNGVVSKDAFLAALVKSQYNLPFLQQLQSSGLEGYVYPASYEFSKTATPADVVSTMLMGFQDSVANNVSLDGQSLSLDQVITLASIVEREAATHSERPIIASVFLNRLRAGIPLQADPTVQFAVAASPESVAQYGWWKRDLTLDDLKIDSPYNTYEHAGLPPGPIANPGVDSIKAVLQPGQTDYLYFVARNDGTHVFAATLEEHQRNVEQYQQ